MTVMGHSCCGWPVCLPSATLLQYIDSRKPWIREFAPSLCLRTIFTLTHYGTGRLKLRKRSLRCQIYCWLTMITQNIHEEPSEIYDQIDWNSVFKHKIYNSDGRSSQFRDLFKNQNALKFSRTRDSQATISSDPSAQHLIIFIRHFFCGNCQEYLRRLVCEPCLSPANLAERNTRVTIIGCGKYSLIASYRRVTKVPQSWQIFTDPTTDLYRVLGMHRTLSLGKRSPRYIQRSLTSGMLQSVVQGMRRIPEGDVMGAGSLSVNGGEFLFSLKQDGSHTGSRAEEWILKWCHRMQNSRDHTEVEDLLVNVGLASRVEAVVQPSPKPLHNRTQSAPLITLDNDSDISEKPEPDLEKSGLGSSSLRRSLSRRRQSWMSTAEQLVRSKSKRKSVHLQMRDKSISEYASPAQAAWRV